MTVFFIKPHESFLIWPPQTVLAILFFEYVFFWFGNILFFSTIISQTSALFNCLTACQKVLCNLKKKKKRRKRKIKFTLAFSN